MWSDKSNVGKSSQIKRSFERKILRSALSLVGIYKVNDNDLDRCSDRIRLSRINTLWLLGSTLTCMALEEIFQNHFERLESVIHNEPVELIDTETGEMKTVTMVTEIHNG